MNRQKLVERLREIATALGRLLNPTHPTPQPLPVRNNHKKENRSR